MSEEPSQKQSPKQDAGKVVLEELTPKPAKKTGKGRSKTQGFLIPILAVFSGLILGAILIIVTDEAVYAGFKQSLGAGLAAAANSVIVAYGALLRSAFGDPAR
ncbi:hypothetical protein FDZ74_01710, partial [bacterium]